MASEISGLSTFSNTNLSTASSTGSNKLGKDEFLKLLVAQLANQDPLSPTDNQQFIAQLAQFSSVEQAEATNSRLDSLLLAQASNNQTATSAFIGKDVMFKSDKVALGPTGGTILGELGATAAKVTVTISDAKGKVVHTIEREQVNAGRLAIAWDGRTADGVQMPEGTYTVKIEATDARGGAITVDTRGRARCTAVTFEAGYPELILNNLRIRMSDIVQVMEPSSLASNAAQTATAKYSF